METTLTAAPQRPPEASAVGVGPAADDDERQSHPRRWAILAIVLVAEVMDLLDGTVTTVAGPSVRADLGGSASVLQWLTAAYTLTFAVLLIIGARLGDVFGRKRMFLIGTVGFTVFSTLCAIAPSPEFLLGSRALQGAFGAMVIPQGFGMMKEAFVGSELKKAMAAFGPVLGLSAVAGPIIAGALIDADLFGEGWRTIFGMNLPLGIIAVVGAIKLFPESERSSGKLDLGGAAIIAGSAFLLIYPLVQGREDGWPAWSFAMLAAGFAGLGIFALHERRTVKQGSEEPLIEPTLLKSGVFTSGLAVALAFFGAMMGMLLVYSLFCQLGLHFSPLKTGLAMAPLPVGIAFTAPASFGLTPKFGRKVIQGGLIINVVGLVSIALVVFAKGGDTTALSLAPGAFVSGLGMGFVLAPLFDLVLGGIEDHQIGSASGVLNAIQQFAAAAGIAGIATIFFSLLDHGHTPAHAVGVTMLATTGLLAAALVASFRLPRELREVEGAH